MRLPEGLRVTGQRTKCDHDGRPTAVEFDVEVSGIVHRCPPTGSGTMPCCGRTPFEVPRFHRMTLDDEAVTCGR